MSLLFLLRSHPRPRRGGGVYVDYRRKRRYPYAELARDIREAVEALEQLPDEPTEPISKPIPAAVEFAARAVETMPGPDFAAIRAELSDLRAGLAYLYKQDSIREEIDLLAELQEEDENLLLILLQ